MQFANEFTTIKLSNREEMLPLAIKMCQLTIPQWCCSIIILLRLEITSAFWLVNTFTRQYSDWSR